MVGTRKIHLLVYVQILHSWNKLATSGSGSWHLNLYRNIAEISLGSLKFFNFMKPKKLMPTNQSRFLN